MAKEITNNHRVLKDGAFFSALYKGKKIMGEVGGYGSFYLYNSQYGDKTNCGDGYLYYIPVGGKTMDDLLDAGVTNFKELTDKRQISVVKATRRKKFDEWTVQISDKGLVVFGCGAVHLSLEEIVGWQKFRNKWDDLNGMLYKGEECLEDVSRKEAMEYYDYQEAINTKDGKLYKSVMDKVEDELDEEHLLKYTTKEVEDLIAYIRKEKTKIARKNTTKKKAKKKK